MILLISEGLSPVMGGVALRFSDVPFLDLEAIMVETPVNGGLTDSLLLVYESLEVLLGLLLDSF